MDSVEKAQAYAETIMINMNKAWIDPIKRDDFFPQNAIALLAGIFWYLKSEFPMMCTLPHAFSMAVKNPKKVLTMLRGNAESAGIIASIITALDEGGSAGGQLAGAISTLQAASKKMLSPAVFYILSGNDFSLKLNDPDTPGILCLGNNDELKDVYGPIDSLVATVALKQMNKPGKLHSMLVADEGPTIYLDFAGIAAVSRSNKLGVAYFAQDISQMESQYGDKEAKKVVANLSNQLFGMCSDLKTAQMVSDMIGTRDKQKISKSKNKNKGGGGKSEGENISDQKEKLIHPHEMGILKPGELVGKLSDIPNPENAHFHIRPHMNDFPKDVFDYNAFALMNDGKEQRPIKEDEIKKVMKDNFTCIQKEVDNIVDAMSRISILEGHGNEKMIFPDHFGPDGRRVKDIFGREVDDKGDPINKDETDEKYKRFQRIFDLRSS
jgi:type IV secretory pathway TraG/TraD family ATPase VirD4